MASWKHLIGVLLISSTTVLCLPTNEQIPVGQPGETGRTIQTSRNAIQTENDLLDSIYADCLRKDSVSCIKYKLFSFVDKMLSQKESFSVTEGVTVVKTANAPEGDGAPRTVSGDETIESLILNRVRRFLETHTLKVDLKGSDVVNAFSSTGRALQDVVDSFSDEDDNSIATEESRGKKKKGKGGLIIGLIAAKLAMLLPLALGAIALLAGKALLIAKIALVISTIIGLKKLFSQQKHVTYEVVSHPHHSSSHVSHDAGYGGSSGYSGDVGYSGGSGHGGWGRSIDAHDLAYRGQQPQQKTQ